MPVRKRTRSSSYLTVWTMAISCAKRDVVRRQHLCDAVFLDAVRYRVLVETQIDEKGLGVVADHKLRKAVRRGIFQNQQLAPRCRKPQWRTGWNSGM